MSTTPVKKLKVSQPALFYGYKVAILAFLILLFSYGLRFSFGVFFTPMSGELGLSSATTSLVFSISMLMEGLFNIILGGIIDKYGPRLVVSISAVLIGAGYCLMPTVKSDWQLFFYYGGLVGIGMGGLFAPLVSIIARWFSAKRNLITGLVISSVGLGVLIISPLANRLIMAFDWRVTFLIFGVVILLVTLICAQFLKRDPSDLGLVPLGDEVKTAKGPNAVAGVDFKDALRSYQFWFVFIILFSYGFCTSSVSIHLIPAAIKTGISASAAAVVLAAIGGLQIVGRIGLGLAADRLGNKIMFIGGFALFALLTFWLPSIGLLSAFFVFAIFFGFAQGGMASSQSPIVARLFGLKSHGLLFGSVGFGFTLGAALGPYFTGHIVDTTGSYQTAFWVCAAISLATAVITIFLKPLKASPIRRIPL